MHKFNVKIVLLLFSLFLFSCAGKKENSASVRLNLSALLASGSISLNGGVLIMGHTLDDNENIYLGVPNGASDHIVELKKGKWEFGVVGWAGNVPMTGAVRCGYSGIVDINTDVFDVKLNLSRGVCKGFQAFDEFIAFSDPNYYDNDGMGDLNQFKKIDVRSCMAVNSSGGCTDPSGLTQSYRFVVEGEQKKAGTKIALPGLVSGCFVSGAGIDDSNGVRLPVGTTLDTFLEYKILAYTSTDCTGNSLVFPFKDRSPVMGLNGSSIKSSLLSESSLSVIYLEHNPNTVNEFFNSNASFYGFGRDGDLTSASFAPNFTLPYNDYAKVTNIDATGTQITLNTVTSNLNVYDEVLWYVNGEFAANACGVSTNRFVTGMFGYGYIKNKTVSANTIIALDKPIHQYRLENATMVSLEIPTAAYLSSNCSIQIIKVRDYKNIYFPATVGSRIYPAKYDGANGIGGVIAMKVNGVIKQNASDQGFDASGMGLDASTPVNGNCYNEGKRCMSLGHSTMDGYNGGGLIQVQALNLDVDVTGDFKFASGGQYVPKWVNISTSTNFSCGVEMSGKIYCWGENNNGQLGDTTLFDRGYPAPINTNQTFSKVKTGMNSACGLTPTGEVYCWGEGIYGQLGQGNTSGSTAPLQVGGLTGITDIVAGRSFYCALKSNNSVYCWGKNESGQFGNNSTTDSLVPILGPSSAVSIFAGGYHMCMIDTSTNLKCWGQNTYGQVGDGTTTNRLMPVMISGFTGAQTLHLGDLFTCVVKSNATVWCWGKGTDGQIGNNSFTSINSTPQQTNNILNITNLYGGSQHVCAKDGSANFYCWGKNDMGAVTGGGAQVPEPRALTFSDLAGQTIQKLNSDAGMSETTCAILSNGGLQCWGKTNSSGYSLIGETSVPDTYKNIQTWSGSSGLTKAGHVNVSMRNISGSNTKTISIHNRDQSNRYNVFDGPIHFRFCQKPSYVTISPSFISAPNYVAVENNLCF